jgi:hypothetical protein
LTALFLASLAGCKKHNEIGLNVQPAGDKFYLYTDSFTIKTYTIAEDTLRSDELSTMIIGAVADPIFGKSETDGYIQCLLQSNNLSFGTAPKFDSAVLTMRYSTINPFYGDANTPQTWNIYELGEDIEYFSDYYSNSTYSKGALISSWTGTFNYTDSVQVGKEKYPPHFRTKLSDAFGQKIVNGGANLADNPTFLQYIKGLAIIPGQASAGGGFAYFNPLSGYSIVTIYYNDSLHIDLPFDLNSRRGARVGGFRHHYSNSSIAASVNDTINDQNTCYLQGQAGVKMYITMPDLFKLTKDKGDSMIVVHGAELIITPQAGSFTNYSLPTKLYLNQIDSLGKNKLIIDRIQGNAYSTGEDYYGGTYDAVKNHYTFNMGWQIQEMYKQWQISGQNITKGFYVIIPSDNPVSASRLIVDTQKNNGNIRLKLTYSIVK